MTKTQAARVTLAVMAAVAAGGRAEADSTLVGRRIQLDVQQRDRGRVPGVPRLTPVRRTGRLAGLDSTALTLDPGAGARARTLALADVDRLALSEGRSAALGLRYGAGYGAAVGLAAGLAFNAVHFDRDDPPTTGEELNRVLAGAAAGALLGAVVGGVRGGEAWRIVPRSRWR